MPEELLPNFLVVGAQKAGTTSIYGQLRAHDEVFMSTRKEIAFFSSDRTFALGVGYYRTFFEQAAAFTSIGEASPNYLSTPQAPQRISQLLPNVKIIASLRDPIERAYSAFHMQIAKGAEPMNAQFVEAVQRNPAYVDMGRYAEQLERYYDYFAKEQVLVVWFDDLRDAPQRFYDPICDFLNVRRIDLSETPVNHALPGRMPRMRAVQKLLRTMRWTYDRLGDSLFAPIVRSEPVMNVGYRVRRAIIRLDRGGSRIPPLTSQMRAAVLPLIEDDNTRLAQLIGRDLRRWNSADVAARRHRMIPQ